MTLGVAVQRNVLTMPAHQGVEAAQSEEPLLIRAVRRGKLDQARQLLDGGADINAVDNGGCTALHHAVSVRRFDIAALLIERGASVRVVSPLAGTPLHEAARRAAGKKVIRLLVKHGADVNEGTLGETPLHLAAAHGAIDEAEELVMLGAHINAREKRFGRTALYFAVERGDSDAVRRLLRLGASPDVADRAGITPLVRAKQLGRQELVDILEGLPQAG